MIGSLHKTNNNGSFPNKKCVKNCQNCENVHNLHIVFKIIDFIGGILMIVQNMCKHVGQMLKYSKTPYFHVYVGDLGYCWLFFSKLAKASFEKKVSYLSRKSPLKNSLFKQVFFYMVFKKKLRKNEKKKGKNDEN